MTLRDDVREYFDREARRVPPPAGLREDVVARAVGAPGRQAPALRWAAVVAALLAVAIVIGLVASGAFRQSKGLVPVGPPIPVTPGTHGLVLDASFANSSDGWALLAQPSQRSFGGTISVEATHDGGGSWLTPVAVGPAIDEASIADSPRHIHFVDRDNGFIWGSGTSYVTHDAGRTWHNAGLPKGLVTITGQEGVAWAVSAIAQVSPDGGQSWLSTASLPITPVGASSFGISGLLLTERGSSDLALTNDGGSTWLRIGGPCPAGTAINGAATSDGREIWEVCTPLPPSDTVPLTQPLVSSVFVSEDSGRTWARSAVDDGGVGTDWLLTATPGTALLGTDTPTGMMISHDGGLTWQRCTTDPSHGSLDGLSYSADGSVVVAVDGIYRVWISRDGGNNWVETPSQP
ncbi:MAG TPA: hypothetical protein VI384_05765 [Candidatus Dormibacteraeota bacterium]